MKTFGNSYSTKKEKGKVFQMCCVWLVVIYVGDDHCAVIVIITVPFNDHHTM